MEGVIVGVHFGRRRLAGVAKTSTGGQGEGTILLSVVVRIEWTWPELQGVTGASSASELAAAVARAASDSRSREPF